MGVELVVVGCGARLVKRERFADDDVDDLVTLARVEGGVAVADFDPHRASSCAPSTGAGTLA
jgi:hypothetical protein